MTLDDFVQDLETIQALHPKIREHRERVAPPRMIRSGSPLRSHGDPVVMLLQYIFKKMAHLPVIIDD